MRKRVKVEKKLKLFAKFLSKKEKEFLLRYARRLKPEYAEILVPALTRGEIPKRILEKYDYKYQRLILEKAYKFMLHHLMVFYRTAGKFQQLCGYQFIKSAFAPRHPFFVEELEKLVDMSAHDRDNWSIVYPFLYVEKLLFELHVPEQVDWKRDIASINYGVNVTKVGLWSMLIAGYGNYFHMMNPLDFQGTKDKIYLSLLSSSEFYDAVKLSSNVLHIMVGNLWLFLFSILSELKVGEYFMNEVGQNLKRLISIILQSGNMAWMHLILPIVQCFYYIRVYSITVPLKSIQNLRIVDHSDDTHVFKDFIESSLKGISLGVFSIDPSRTLSFLIALNYLLSFEDKLLYLYVNKYLKEMLSSIKRSSGDYDAESFAYLSMELKTYVSDLIFWMIFKENKNEAQQSCDKVLEITRFMSRNEKFKEFRSVVCLWENILTVEGFADEDIIASSESFYKWSLRNAKHLLPIARWLRRNSYKWNRFTPKSQWCEFLKEWKEIVEKNPNLLSLEEYVPVTLWLRIKCSEQEENFRIRIDEKGLPIGDWVRFFGQWVSYVEDYFTESKSVRADV